MILRPTRYKHKIIFKKTIDTKLIETLLYSHFTVRNEPVSILWVRPPPFRLIKVVETFNKQTHALTGHVLQKCTHS